MSRITLAVLSLVLGGSLAMASPTRDQPRTMPAGQGVEVVTHNATNGMVRAYLLQGGHMIPLGLAMSEGSTTATVPQVMVESEMDFTLIADPLDSSDWFQSTPMSMEEGSTFDFSVASDLAQSSVEAHP